MVARSALCAQPGFLQTGDFVSGGRPMAAPTWGLKRTAFPGRPYEKAPSVRFGFRSHRRGAHWAPVLPCALRAVFCRPQFCLRRAADGRPYERAPSVSLDFPNRPYGGWHPCVRILRRGKSKEKDNPLRRFSNRKRHSGFLCFIARILPCHASLSHRGGRTGGLPCSFTGQISSPSARAAKPPTESTSPISSARVPR